MEDLALNWLAAFNAKDLNKLLSLYHENAKHYSPKLKLRNPESDGFISGKLALRIWWKDAFDRLPTLSYVLVKLTANNARVFMEYIIKVDGEPELFVAEVLEVENGEIVASRVYHG